MVGYVVRTRVLRATEAHSMHHSSLPACEPSVMDSPHLYQTLVVRRFVGITASIRTAHVHVLLVARESESEEKSSRRVTEFSTVVNSRRVFSEEGLERGSASVNPPEGKV